MNRMDYVDKVKPGDTVRIVPIAKVPNADREFKVNDLLEEGFLYGLSTTSDGYVMPYSWIKSLKVIKPGKDVSSCRRFTKYPSGYVKASRTEDDSMIKYYIYINDAPYNDAGFNTLKKAISEVNALIDANEVSGVIEIEETTWYDSNSYNSRKPADKQTVVWSQTI